jgi:DNA-binding CsgD family transcriptional regulator
VIAFYGGRVQPRHDPVDDPDAPLASTDIRGEPVPYDDLHGPPHHHPYLPMVEVDQPITILHRAAGREDPEERAKALTEHLAVAARWVAWGSAQRDIAVLQMREQGRSYDHIARALGISKSRAQQLVQRLRAAYPDGVAATGWKREGHDIHDRPVAVPQWQLDGLDGPTA